MVPEDGVAWLHIWNSFGLPKFKMFNENSYSSTWSPNYSRITWELFFQGPQIFHPEISLVWTCGKSFQLKSKIIWGNRWCSAGNYGITAICSTRNRGFENLWECIDWYFTTGMTFLKTKSCGNEILIEDEFMWWYAYDL